MSSHYAAIIASSDDAIISNTLQGLIVSWNLAAEKLFGYSREETAGQPLALIIPEERSDEENRAMEQVRGGIAVKPFETVRRCKDGRLVDVVVAVSAVHDDEGVIIGDFWIARIISGCTPADEKIQASMREITQLKSALDEHAIVAITDPRGDITYVNDKFCEISKYSREDLLGQNHRIINSGYHPKEFFVDLWSTISSGRVWKGEIKNRAKDGSFYWVDTTIVPFLNEQGRPVQYVAIRADITSRMLALEALTERSAALWHYAAIVASSDDAIISKTLQGLITSWNPAAEKLFGYSREEAVGQPLKLIIPEEHHDEETHILEQLSTGYSVEPFDTVRRRKDGRLIDISVVVSPIHGDQGSIIGGTQIARDISARKQAEEKIQASLREINQLKAALDEHAIVAITSPRGDITYVNDKFCEISKYSREELLGQNHRIINSGHHPKQFFVDLWSTIASGRVWKGEIKNRAKDGSFYWVDTTIVPFLNERGKPMEYVAIRADITQRKLATDALQARSHELERSAAALEISVREITQLKAALDEHAIVAITDPRGDITYVNDKFCQISKYSREELLGQNHRIINSGHHPKEFFDDLWKTISGGHVWKGEIGNRAKDGSIYWVDTTIVPFLSERGKPMQYVAIRADITSRMLALGAVTQRSEALARSNAAMEEFAYAASHDLQEPLRGVSGCIQLLQKNYSGKLDARADEFIRHSVANVERMQALILALLDYTRVDRRGNPFKIVDSGAVLRDTLANLSVAIEESGAQVTFAELPSVLVDRNQLLQLFQNLLSNAIKFRGAEAPRLHIDVESGGVANAAWTFRIRDNGIGIDPRHAQRIFGVFQRLHTRDKYPGTGIGLAICRRIVERHGGRLWVESVPGQGATFVFTLGQPAKEGSV